MAKGIQKAVKKIQTDHGELNRAEYEYKGVSLYQQELFVKQQLAITPILVEAGIANVTSFDDVASINVEFLASRLLVSGKAVDFLMAVLKRTDGAELAQEFIEDATGTQFNALFGDVMRDFFFSNPSLLPNVILPYAQSQMQGEMIQAMKNSSTSSVVEGLLKDQRFSQPPVG